MTDHDSSDPDRELNALYRALPAVEPPSEVDDAVLAASRRAVASKPRGWAASPFTTAWQVPVSMAAVLALAVTLVVLLEDQVDKPVPFGTSVQDRVDEIAPPSSVVGDLERRREAQTAAAGNKDKKFESSDGEVMGFEEALAKESAKASAKQSATVLETEAEERFGAQAPRFQELDRVDPGQLSNRPRTQPSPSDANVLRQAAEKKQKRDQPQQPAAESAGFTGALYGQSKSSSENSRSTGPAFPAPVKPERQVGQAEFADSPAVDEDALQGQLSEQTLDQRGVSSEVPREVRPQVPGRASALPQPAGAPAVAAPAPDKLRQSGARVNERAQARSELAAQPPGEIAELSDELPDIDSWLAQIRSLRARGMWREADASLAALRRAYPDVPTARIEAGLLDGSDESNY